MRALRNFAAAGIVGVALWCAFTPTATASQERLAGADHYIEKVRGDWNNVGLAIAVVSGTDILYAKGFGKRQWNAPAQVDADTLFQIGSLTKAFTATAAGMLVDQRALRWDDLVIDHLPDLRLQDPWVTRHLTLRDALTHRSGLTSSVFPFLSPMDADETLQQLRYLAPEGAFRDSYRYSNLMYAVCGQIVGVTSDSTWNELVRGRLLHPLRMKRTVTSPYEIWDARDVAPTFLGTAPAGRTDMREARDANVAMPHAFDEKGSVRVLAWQSYDNAAAAGGLVSSAADMANWLILQLNEGRFENQQLLTRETMHELHRTQNVRTEPEFPFEETKEGYALGWHRARYEGHPHLFHGGGITGFPAYIALLTDQKLGVVILSNGPKEKREKLALHKAIAFWIFDRLLGLPERDWHQAFLHRSRATRLQLEQQLRELDQGRLAAAGPALSLDQYAGTYIDADLHSVRIRVRQERRRLVLSFAGEGAFSAPLEHWHRDLFRLHPAPGVADVLGPQFASFAVDARGKVTTMTLFETNFQRSERDDAPAIR